MRRGLFTDPVGASIVLRSDEPLEFWWPETQKVCAGFGVRVWQEKMTYEERVRGDGTRVGTGSA